MKLRVKFDGRALTDFSKAVERMAKQAPDVMRLAVLQCGEKAKAAVIPALAKQTGLKEDTIVRAVRPTVRAHGDASYTLTTRGGDISLKYFGAHETEAGVSAAPYGQRRIFARTFIKGGRWPDRKDAKKLNGHVYQRKAGQTAWRSKIRKEKSGVFIPDEMLRGETRAAFDRIAEQELPRIALETLSKLMPK